MYAQHGRAVGTQMYIPQSAAHVRVALEGKAGVRAAIEVYGMGSAYV